MKKIIAMLILLLSILTVISPATAAENDENCVWVLCQPDSYVVIREGPRRKSAEGGSAYCGDRFETDWKEKNGFIHVFASTESGEGWISKGYIVLDEPKPVMKNCRIRSGGRVAVRASIGGKRTRWAKSGSEIKVYWTSAEWAVTSKGFVMAEFIEKGEE